MGVTFIQAKNGGTFATGVTSCTTTFGSATTGSSYLLFWILADSAGGTTTVTNVTDTLLNTWIQIFHQLNGSAGHIYIFAVPTNKAAGGANTVTATFSTGVQSLIMTGVAEYTNQNANAVDAVTNEIQSTGTSYIGNQLTTQFTNETVLAIGGLDYGSPAVTVTGTNNWIVRSPSSTNLDFLLLEHDAPTSGIYTPTNTLSLSKLEFLSTLALKSTTSTFSPLSGDGTHSNRSLQQLTSQTNNLFQI